MKNKIIAFVAAILLPNLTWACAGAGGGIIGSVLNWAVALAGFGSIVTIVVLSIAWSLKKDKENKRSKWWMIFITITFVFGLIFFYLDAVLTALIFLAVFFGLLLLVTLRREEENKRLKWWIVFSTIVLVFSLFMLIAIKAQENMLCGTTPNF